MVACTIQRLAASPRKHTIRRMPYFFFLFFFPLLIFFLFFLSTRSMGFSGSIQSTQRLRPAPSLTLRLPPRRRLRNPSTPPSTSPPRCASFSCEDLRRSSRRRLSWWSWRTWTPATSTTLLQVRVAALRWPPSPACQAAFSVRGASPSPARTWAGAADAGCRGGAEDSGRRLPRRASPGAGGGAAVASLAGIACSGQEPARGSVEDGDRGDF